MAARSEDLELSVSHERVVRLCRRLSGDRESADDLAQQVLIEAWLHEADLRDPARRDQWLDGITRNVYRRWLRSRARENARKGNFSEEPVGEANVELELERDELADLLDRALELLRPEDRALLIAHYIDGLSKKELADRLGLRAGTLTVRLHRGRLALRHVLSNELHDDAATHGLPVTRADGFLKTDLWCYLCAERRMTARIDPASGILSFRCQKCCPEDNAFVEQFFGVGPVARIRSARKRGTAFYQEYGWPAIQSGVADCMQCGTEVQVRRQHPYRPYEVFPALRPEEHGAFYRCPTCRVVSNLPLRLLAFGLPEVQAFWKQYPRLKLKKEQQAVVSGKPVFQVGVESVADRAAIDVVCSAETYRIIDIRETSPTSPVSFARA